MGDGKRLSICYAALGHDLLSSAGPTRNVLYVAEALSQWANVTVAFRSVLEPIVTRDYAIVEVEPHIGRLSSRVDDAVVRGMSLRELITYLRTVRRFADDQLYSSYDIVLEKGWLFSGYLVSLCQQRGLPGVVIENMFRFWNEPVRDLYDVMRYVGHRLIQTLVGRYLRRAPVIIAETETLRTALAQRWRIPTERIKVSGLGIDHRLFRPLDQATARNALGIPLDKTVLLYAGVLDKTHNLTPVLEAMREVPNPSLALHIVGDGMLRDHYEEMAHAGQSNVFFHGRAPHVEIPQYIAAADLCLAPYDPTAFPNGQVAYATLKIPEYMACARPVASVPSGHILTLIQHGVSGFLIRCDTHSWIEFLHNCPSPEQLKRMGATAATMVASYSWDATASAYLALCEQLVRSKHEAQALL
jgi:glycosyltransferase involved in cell wall biosynthesis